MAEKKNGGDLREVLNTEGCNLDYINIIIFDNINQTKVLYIRTD